MYHFRTRVVKVAAVRRFMETSWNKFKNESRRDWADSFLCLWPHKFWWHDTCNWRLHEINSRMKVAGSEMIHFYVCGHTNFDDTCNWRLHEEKFKHERRRDCDDSFLCLWPHKFWWYMSLETSWNKFKNERRLDWDDSFLCLWWHNFWWCM
jgi:hypothetical protein